ncbi:mRNA decay activator protein zfp36l1 [Anaeramoeba ignava]|uniref:mRNA decay activator protein zfp36l1 n=1 Tax=Anaeramoeba ignava TaxID=1746090 RepID=A0A9Q0LR04_ANAIG|nr:mRNA decay activator protein zfp36l1 [Anaeramoeba ignava]
MGSLAANSNQTINFLLNHSIKSNNFKNPKRFVNKIKTIESKKNGNEVLSKKSLKKKITKKKEYQEQNLSYSKNQLSPSLYKTELCRSWEETGFCKYGGKCQFAHGEHELRNIARHPKYKTQVCKSFHKDGFCCYGKRCRFIHDKIESTTNPTQFELFSLEPKAEEEPPKRLNIFRLLC